MTIKVFNWLRVLTNHERCGKRAVGIHLRSDGLEFSLDCCHSISACNKSEGEFAGI
jgi:hypothetical protein